MSYKKLRLLEIEQGYIWLHNLNNLLNNFFHQIQRKSVIY